MIRIRGKHTLAAPSIMISLPLTLRSKTHRFLAIMEEIDKMRPEDFRSVSQYSHRIGELSIQASMLAGDRFAEALRIQRYLAGLDPVVHDYMITHDWMKDYCLFRDEVGCDKRLLSVRAVSVLAQRYAREVKSTGQLLARQKHAHEQARDDQRDEKPVDAKEQVDTKIDETEDKEEKLSARQRNQEKFKAVLYASWEKFTHRVRNREA